VIVPGSTIRVKSWPVNEVRSACTPKVTRAASPAASGTRVNPASHFTGRATEATASPRYGWTTSVPATGPAFRTVQEISTAPSVATSLADSARPEYSNAVYESPCPNANSGVGSTELPLCRAALRVRR